jgi:NAD(P)-dependent dehydrogenase (short-subunit alcohol dehydrogenase family)
MPTDQISLDGRAAIVTGSGGGLGRSYALSLAARGASVLVNDIGVTPDGREPSPTPAETVVAEIEATGGSAVPNFDSVATRTGAEAIVSAALDAFGRVDAVVNNAGVFLGGDLGALEQDQVDGMLNTHLLGSLWLTNAVFPHMRAQQFGRCVFITSANAVFGSTGGVMYGVVKTGMIGLMHAAASTGAPDGILANAVAPVGKTRLGEQMDSIPPEQLPPEARRMHGATANYGDSGGPDFVAPLVAYLCSPACTVTQEAFSAVAGRYARIFTGVTAGWWGPRDRPPTLEEIDQHFAEIENQEGYQVPQSVTDELEIVAAALPSVG